MSDHAPTPWSIHPYVDAIIINDRDGVPVASLSDRELGGDGMPPDNAKRIVTAVNCFDDLLAALEQVLNTGLNGHDDMLLAAKRGFELTTGDIRASEAAVMAAQAAIKKARGVG